ncbi:unnamed protein product, partial [Amoebophrya sp. A25]
GYCFPWPQTFVFDPHPQPESENSQEMARKVENLRIEQQEWKEKAKKLQRERDSLETAAKTAHATAMHDAKNACRGLRGQVSALDREKKLLEQKLKQKEDELDSTKQQLQLLQQGDAFLWQEDLNAASTSMREDLQRAILASLFKASQVVGPTSSASLRGGEGAVSRTLLE